MPKLFKKLKSSSEVPPVGGDFLISVILTNKQLQAALVKRGAKQPEIKEFSKVKQYFDRQDLAEQLDQALQELGPDSEEVTETVFNFADNWLDGVDLKADKKAIIKDVSEQLSLEALGQLSISQALARARVLADEHDSSLMIFLEEKSFDLLLIKHGEFLAAVNVGRSNEIVADLQEGLARITREVGEEGKYFPNKLFLSSLILKEKELGQIQDTITEFDWSNFAGFLQIPEVEVLEADYLIKAVSLSAASSLGEVIDKIEPTSKAETKLESKAEAEADQDQETKTRTVENDASSFGIAIDQDLIKESLARPIEKKVIQKNETAIIENKPKKLKKRSSLGRFLTKNKKGVLIGAGAGLISLLVLVTVYALFLANFTIVLTPERQILQKKVAVTLDPDLKESDFENYLLKASLVDKELSGEDVLNTTGISLVGEKAKGKAKIFNKTSDEETLGVGTVLSYEEIRFSLDDEVKVASATEKAGGSGVDYGQVEANVTAIDIGADANINKETKLRVADYYDDSFSAQAVDNFSGGSSREIRVVSPEDISKLATELKQVLIDDASEEFSDDSKDGVYFIPTGNSKTLSAEYSHQEGEEVESLVLNLTIEVEAVKYSSSDLKQLAIEVLKQDLPDGYKFVDEEPELMSDNAKEASDTAQIVIDTELFAKAEAELDENALTEVIKGQAIEQALNLLISKDGIKAARVDYQPSFFLKILKKLPNNAERIKLVIEN